MCCAAVSGGCAAVSGTCHRSVSAAGQFSAARHLLYRPLFLFFLGDCAHKSALLFGPITEHFLHQHPASSSSAPPPKQCMNLSKGKMLYHLANAYFIVCKTMYGLPFDLRPSSLLRPLPRLEVLGCVGTDWLSDGGQSSRESSAT